jgi:hypothetical protein
VEPESLPIELEITSESSRYEPSDGMWLEQTADLHRQLQLDVDGFRHAPESKPGTKGAADSVVLALGSAGAFSAAVQCFRAWLARDKQRRLVVVVSRGDEHEKVVIEGDGLSGSSFDALTQAVATRLKDAGWPSDIEPS